MTYGQRTQPASPRPLMATWSVGIRLEDEQHDGKNFAGMFLDVDRDRSFDAAVLAAGWQRGQMAHQRNNGPSAIVDHWLAPKPTPLIVLISGLPYRIEGDPKDTISAMVDNADKVAEMGLRCRWPENGTSSLAAQVLFPDLLPHGFVTPVPFGVNSTLTGDFLITLLAHNAMLDKAEEANRNKVARHGGKVKKFAYWDMALLLAPGKITERGKAGATARIQAMTYAGPGNPSIEELRGLYRPNGVDKLIARHWRNIQRWARG